MISNVISKPKVSVLMTVYNGETYLRKTISCILNQTFKNFEFLIVDDCSKDNTKKIIKSFNDDRIRLLSNNLNIGQTKSLNKGLKEAKGEYIARMDSDDISFPNWLEKSINFLDENSDYHAVGCSALVIDENNIIYDTLNRPTDFSGVIFNIFFGTSILHVGSLINKVSLEGVGGYTEDIKIVQDFDLWSKFIKSGFKIISISDILVAVRVYPNSLGGLNESTIGVSEMSQIICENVKSFTKLNLSFNDAKKMRLFYRFPEKLNEEEFAYTNNLYLEVFGNIKNELFINKVALSKMIKNKMLIPYLKRAIYFSSIGNVKRARKIIYLYLKNYGFHIQPLILIIFSFISPSIITNIMVLKNRFLKIILKLYYFSYKIKRV